MRFISILLLFACFFVKAQSPIYDFVNLTYSDKIPENLNNSRSAVIINVPYIHDEFIEQGDWNMLAKTVHDGFVKMKVDAILYLNHTDLIASSSSLQNYIEIFDKRRVKNLIFVTEKEDQFEIVISQNTNSSQLLKDGESAYKVEAEALKPALLSLGKEIRRAELNQGNFLIPDKPTFLKGRSIIENTQLKNYPGQLRRSVLAVERFDKMPEPEGGNNATLRKVQAYNASIDAKNVELDSIVKQYPYEYVMIDKMSDEELLRNRHQFVLRSITGSATSVREMLEFEVLTTRVDFVSVIPIMPDRKSIKTIPKDALVTKFYVRQNISKNVHVGEWDADVTWQSALKNMIGNLSQRLVIRN